MAASTPTTTAARDLVLDTITGHAASLLATARRYSLCADDAQDAYQRALEIFLRHRDHVSPDGAAAWLRTVVKHEALAVRSARLRLVGPAEADLDLHEARELTPAEERACDAERMRRAAEALRRLKPQEVRALVLKAHGYSYREICEITGWSYTKVNRCLVEGRQALARRLADIEAGRECRRWAPVLSALAEGRAGREEALALRPHLRACGGCRGSLRGVPAARGGNAPETPIPPREDT